MRVELRSISKRFGQVQANDGISLGFEPGRIIGLLGENGAGKTTLMKILSGFLTPDSGEILLDGHKVRFRSAADALRRGIGMLHQDPLDFPSLAVIENFAAGQPGLAYSPAAFRKKLQQWQAALGFDFPLESETGALTVGERQQAEIARLLALDARVLILDEPTTGISAAQKDQLFAALRALAAQGRTVVLVSHKLADVQMLCSEVHVLRQGRHVGSRTAPLEADELVRLMFGHDLAIPSRPTHPLGDPVLRIEGLVVESARLRLQTVTLDLRAGEIVGLAGMEGSGQELLLRACAGLVRPVAGRIMRNGHNGVGKPYRWFRKQGVVFAPAARREEGLIGPCTVAEHMALIYGGALGLIRWGEALTRAQQAIQDFEIQGTPATTAESLSGGNQQRLLLSLLPVPWSVLLLEHPTRGLDVESAASVWNKLLNACARGAAVMFSSSDLEELLRYSHRILVFFGGHVTGPLPAESCSVTSLGERIGGKT